MRLGQIDLLDLELPLVLRPSRRLRDDDLIRFSEQNKPYKIERNKDGDITIMTPVGGIGSTHEAYVGHAFYEWNENAKTGVAFMANAGFNLPDGSCLSPDAAWLSLGRWNALSPEEQAGYPPVCPEFLIEIRSRSDPRKMVETKMQLWLDNGARLAWLIDPIESAISIYRPAQRVEALDRPEVLLAGDPVAGFELLCSRLWTQRG